MSAEPPLLEVKNLRVTFPSPSGEAAAVDGVSFALRSGETLGIVGESGSGKSATALSLLSLVPAPGILEADGILYRGRNLLSLSEEELCSVRGNELSMIFQEPMTSLNPVYTAGEQVAETLRLHRNLSRRDALERAIELFTLVGIPAPEDRVRAYPHQLSGGMRQRVMIAMALACEPDVLIADEPTTALDVTIQAQILDLMASLKERLGMSILLITHDLGVVAEVCSRVLVMYAGRIVEAAPASEIFLHPRHPYTAGLLASMPGPGIEGDLREIPGQVPPIHRMPKGCKFASRCDRADQKCRESEPELVPLGPSQVRCHHPLEEARA